MKVDILYIFFIFFISIPTKYHLQLSNLVYKSFTECIRNQNVRQINEPNLNQKIIPSTASQLNHFKLCPRMIYLVGSLFEFFGSQIVCFSKQTCVSRNDHSKGFVFDEAAAVPYQIFHVQHLLKYLPIEV